MKTFEEVADLLEIVHAHVEMLGTSFNEVEQVVKGKQWNEADLRRKYF